MRRNDKDNWMAGINAVAAALEHDAMNVREVMVEARTRNLRVQELAELARGQGIAVRMVAADVLERVAGGVRHQGIVAHYVQARTFDEGDLLALVESAEAPLFLILDGVQDPHNLGACLRSAAAAGVTAVVIPRDKSASITATVRKTSAGAADRIPVVRVTNLARAMETLKQAGVWLVGMAGEAVQSLYASDLRGATGIVMGGEGDGLRRLTREHCDYLVKIPMPGEIESLNVSVATGIALFEAVRQRLSGR